jgi:hypothetical protein
VATSGSVSQTVFTTRKVIDHAFRRCKLPAQAITVEMIDVARDLLFLQLSELQNKGLPLWRIEKQILGIYQGSNAFDLDVGTVDVLNANLRTLQRILGEPSSSEGDAALAFDGDPYTACTQIAPGGTITVEYAGPTPLSNFGILPNANGTWNFRIQTSADGVTWFDVYVNAAYAALKGRWLWIDRDQLINTEESASLNDILFCRIQATAPTVLDVAEFVTANTPNEIPLARINRDDWVNLPDKVFQGRPVQFWLDRQRDRQVMRIWPAADDASDFRQIVAWCQMYVQDVGTLTQTLDIPQRWYNAIVFDLAWRVAMETPDVKTELVPLLKAQADEAMRAAWNEEVDASPIYLRPNFSAYTA